jgi:N-acyl-D-aspartate/D-glutamate deacylase
MLDLLIRDARLIDGTGKPGYSGDLGVKDGRIATIGKISDSAKRTIDAGGRVLAPGFVDMHTHYDAMVFWNPELSPSCLHGVTSVFAGNCGFSIAPLSPSAAPYLLRMLARVEGMPEKTLEVGVPWDWESFADYLGKLEGRIGLNFGAMCGHSALRRTVMGQRGVSEPASEDDLAKMKVVLAESLAAGAMGFSTTVSIVHHDAEGHPVPSRAASDEELLALCRVCRDHPGTSIELAPGIDRFSPELIELMTQMSLASDRAVNWNAVGATPGNEDLLAHQLAASDHARAHGGEILALTVAANASVRLNFETGFFLESLPGWGSLFQLPTAERLAALGNPDKRRELEAGAASRADGIASLMSKFDGYTITASGDRAVVGERLADVAARQDKSVFDAMCDMVIADELRTVFSPTIPPADETLWQRRCQLWQDDRAMIGASDAGAHLDMIDTFHYTSYLLGVARERPEVIGLEHAVRELAGRPAEFMGLTERGELHEGWHADLTLFDPGTVGERPTHVRHDLPDGGWRLFGEAQGIDYVVVNGTVIVEGGEHCGELPGKVLRSGRDTHTYRPKSMARAGELA